MTTTTEPPDQRTYRILTGNRPPPRRTASVRSPSEMPALLYAAHPMTCYGSAHEQACLDAIARAFRGAEVLDPATCFAARTDWLAGWPALLDALSGVVLFADECGYVGAGCLREVADAIGASVPVLFLDRRLRIRELTALALAPVRTRTPARSARPVGGPVLVAPARHLTRPREEGLHANL